MTRQKKDETANAELLSSSNTVQSMDGDVTSTNDIQVCFKFMPSNLISYLTFENTIVGYLIFF